MNLFFDENLELAHFILSFKISSNFCSGSKICNFCLWPQLYTIIHFTSNTYVKCKNTPCSLVSLFSWDCGRHGFKNLRAVAELRNANKCQCYAEALRKTWVNKWWDIHTMDYYYTAEFLNLCMGGGEGWPVNCRMVSSNSPTFLWQPAKSLDINKCPLRGKMTPGWQPLLCSSNDNEQIVAKHNTTANTDDSHTYHFGKRNQIEECIHGFHITFRTRQN